jgi:hypothetical protein
MWTFSAFADWQSTGRTSFLQFFPPSITNAAGFTNPQIVATYLGQLADPVSNQVQLQILSLPGSDVTNLQYNLGFSGGPPPASPQATGSCRHALSTSMVTAFPT